MTFWLAGNWFHHIDPRRSGRYYVGNDQMIYDLHGSPTGYGLIKRDEEVYISGRDAWLPVGEHGNVGDYLPFEDEEV